jgi:chromosome transmission fidelity protein 1
MQPFDEYMDHLFRPLGISSERLHTFSCGHVIPDSNLLTVALGVGPNQIKLNYTFQNRNNSSLIEETGRTIANLCQVVPGGVVCFFPSYDYENLLFTHWSKSGLLKSIESKGKRVFREPKQSNLVQSTLADYSRSIGSVNSKKGALLMCVVGGKMSEGINFSDDLGRGVIVVGLPYANKNSIELQEKLKYLNDMKPDSGNVSLIEHKFDFSLLLLLNFQVYYENLCMKAVNQSIGRAIRHKNDYAVIVLLDNRYTNRQNIKESLPKWIRSRLMCFDKFPQAFGSVRQFFSNK